MLSTHSSASACVSWVVDTMANDFQYKTTTQQVLRIVSIQRQQPRLAHARRLERSTIRTQKTPLLGAHADDDQLWRDIRNAPHNAPSSAVINDNALTFDQAGQKLWCRSIHELPPF